MRTLGIAGALVVVGLLLDTARDSAWDQLGVAAALVSAVLALLVLWFATPGIAFGDVLMLTFAFLVPAWLWPLAVGCTILVTLAVGGAVAAAQRHHRHAYTSAATIAFGSALLAGCAAGVVIG